jgi:type III secretion system FlhB-like substrate exporter
MRMKHGARYFQAFALSLPNGEQDPPVLAARGEYDLADEMVRVARRLGVPVVEKVELCEALAPLPLEQRIPTELFEAAAALMAEVGALSRNMLSKGLGRKGKSLVTNQRIVKER